MVARKIQDGIFWVGAIDWDRRLFDELIPLPNGTSYNAYLILGSEKVALIDTVDPTKEYELISNLVRLGTEKIDYIIVNHAEQDHSGVIPRILARYPMAQVVHQLQSYRNRSVISPIRCRISGVAYPMVSTAV
jgi:flavorubredoxin